MKAPLLLAVTVAACAAPKSSPTPSPRASQSRAAVDYELPVARAPFQQVTVNYKERLDQAYVYVEVIGDPAQAGREIPRVFSEMKRLHVEPSGPPFTLYYGDRRSAASGTASVAAFISRACVPVELNAAPAGLSFDVLPTATVAYAFAAGPYPDAHGVYDGILDFARKMSWRASWPVRETFLVSPASVADFADLVCEVQVPVGDAR